MVGCCWCLSLLLICGCYVWLLFGVLFVNSVVVICSFIIINNLLQWFVVLLLLCGVVLCFGFDLFACVWVCVCGGYVCGFCYLLLVAVVLFVCWILYLISRLGCVVAFVICLRLVALDCFVAGVERWFG